MVEHARVTDARLTDVEARVDPLAARVDVLEAARTEAEARLSVLGNLQAVEAVSRFIRHTRLRTHPLVSVVLPTYNRPERLRLAVESVLAQRYPRWELIVVDDGGQGDSRAIVEEAGDSRVRWMRVDHGGACAARNAALASASGQIIAYLDDDNRMDPDWLYAVAWAFEQRPDADLLYGAFVVDDPLRIAGESSGQLPRMFLHEWNRERLRQHNLADMGAIAHRSGLAEARFDEQLTQAGDWDLLLRLTAESDPLVLPAIACYYTTDAPDRLTAGPSQQGHMLQVLQRVAAASE
jgi:Glycosyl transferase family 2